MFHTIDDITDFFQKRQLFGIKPGLKRVFALLKAVGSPQSYIPTIHVAGTNGKGSTIQFIANALIANKYNVGVFSSPSFTGLTGHFLKNNEPIRKEKLISLMNEIFPHIETLDNQNEHPTEFEIITVIALLFFKENVDIALIETGMGGKFDTTNCVMPVLSIITTIDFDHQHFLGNTIAEISVHKAGIIKQSRPVIIGNLQQDAKKVVLEEAHKNGSPVYMFNQEFFITEKADLYTWHLHSKCMCEFCLQMKGKHQAENAAIALMTLHFLQKEKNYRLDWQRVKNALSQTVLPGRFEKIHNDPPIYLDSAHNVAGIKAFIATVKKECARNDMTVLFAGFKDKRLMAMINELNQEKFRIKITSFDHNRAQTVEVWKKALYQHPFISIVDDWQSEIMAYLQQKETINPLFVTGSLHFITLVRQFIIDYNE